MYGKKLHPLKNLSSFSSQLPLPVVTHSNMSSMTVVHQLLLTKFSNVQCIEANKLWLQRRGVKKLCRRRPNLRRQRGGGGCCNSKCSFSFISNIDSFEVGRLIGSYGFMNVTSYSGIDQQDISMQQDMGSLFRVQNVGEGNVQIRLYEGRISQGPRKGTSVVFKVYPGQQVGGVQADMMASNELNAHASLQSSPGPISQNIQILLGDSRLKPGNRYTVAGFSNDGLASAADYAKVTSEKMSKFRVQGQPKFWNPFEKDQTIKRRRDYVRKLLQGALKGLAYMHDNDRLHQSLGPSSIVINTMVEKDAAFLVPRLRDLAFSVDIRFSNLDNGFGTLSEGLWRRASMAEAFSPLEKRAFGIADDIYEAGLLFACLAFVPFCEVGVMDSLSLRRLLESTFKLDLVAAREYCLADDRLAEAVNFLDLGHGAGWELLQAMLDPDFRKRPIAEAVLNHRFFSWAFV